MPRKAALFIAWILAATWLPAAMKCSADTAGILAAACCASDEDHEEAEGADHCDVDHCDVVEMGAPRPDLVEVGPIPAMAVVALLWAFDVSPRLDPDASGCMRERAAPPEIAGRWRSIERVAPLAQAP